MANQDMKILVVDDFEVARNIAKRELTHLGFKNIDEASDGHIAFDKMKAAIASNQPYQLVLSDWHMPNCTGFEFLQKIRNEDAFKTVPFLMVSAESETESIVSALQNGANDFICKPLTGEALGQKIGRILNKLNKAA